MDQTEISRPIFPVRLLRYLFHLLYHPLAWTYDWVAWTVSVGMWQRWVFSVLPVIEGPHVLELGPGPGHLLKKLIQDPARKPVALEKSPQMRRIARRNLAKAGLAARILAGDALDLPFKSQTFDTIVATFPAEYIANPITWQQAARVLKPGGRFVVLLGAQVIGGGILHRAAALLFRVTGQAGALEQAVIRSRLEAALDKTDLQTRIIQKQVGKSRVFTVIAEKIAAA